MTKSNPIRESALTEILEKIAQGQKIRALSREYGIPESTIRGRKNGLKNTHASHEAAQKLSPIQEKELVWYILEEEAAGRALSKRDVHAFAQELVNLQNPDTHIGRHWVSRFLKRHQNIKIKGFTSTEATRIKYVTPESIRRFFVALSQQMVDKSVGSDRLFNMDEHGITEGMTRAGKVIGTAETNQAIVTESDCREWVSIIEAGSALGRRLPPCVIFSGNNLQTQWFSNNFPDWAYDCSPTGWANSRICEKWLREVFIPKTQPSNPSLWRILVIDGFRGHVSPRFRFLALFHRVQVIYLPPHSSHITQPFDVGVFGPLKRAFQHHARQYASMTATSPIQKQRFIEIYKIASEEAVTKENIRAGFLGAGTWPIDPMRPLAKVVTTNEHTPLESAPRTPKRQKVTAKDIPYTPRNKVELVTQLNSVHDGLSGVGRSVRGIAQKAGNELDRMHAVNAKLRAENAPLKAEIDSRKRTERRAVKYNPVASFPTSEEIKTTKEAKDKRRRKRKQHQRHSN